MCTGGGMRVAVANDNGRSAEWYNLIECCRIVAGLIPEIGQATPSWEAATEICYSGICRPGGEPKANQGQPGIPACQPVVNGLRADHKPFLHHRQELKNITEN